MKRLANELKEDQLLADFTRIGNLKFDECLLNIPERAFTMSMFKNITAENVYKQCVEYLLRKKDKICIELLVNYNKLVHKISNWAFFTNYLNNNFSTIIESIYKRKFNINDLVKRIQLVREKNTSKVSIITNSPQQEKIGKWVNYAIDDIANKYFNLDMFNIYAFIKDINTNNFAKECSKHILDNDRKSIIDQLTNMYCKESQTSFKNIIRDFFTINFYIIARKAFNILYSTDKDKQRVINKYLNKNTDLINKVLKAYKNVKEWLKQDYPNLELVELPAENITIVDSDNYDASCGFTFITNPMKLVADIEINRNVLDIGESALAKIIYHELIHCIKRQGKEGRLLKFLKQNNMSDHQFQKEVHNDEIWDQGSNAISKRTHLDLDSNYSSQEDNAFYENDNISEKLARYNSLLVYSLNEPHEATLICYNCGWFNIYEKWNDDCDKAVNGQFICPECRRNDVKLISPGPGEKDLINDAFSHLQNISVEIKRNLEPSKKRLQHRIDRRKEIEELQKKRK